VVRSESISLPAAHTADGGVLLGRGDAPRRLVLFEDPQCPYCRQFEEISGALIRSAWQRGDVAVEYRMRCFLGVESVRANNALALAAEASRFDELRNELFASQPDEGSGGFTIEDLLALGHRVGLADHDYITGVKTGRYEPWALSVEGEFQRQDPQGTPAAVFNGEVVDSRVLTDTRALEALVRS
jgi:Thioredoxin